MAHAKRMKIRVWSRRRNWIGSCVMPRARVAADPKSQRSSSDHVLAFVAPGPLEDLVRLHCRQFVDRIEAIYLIKNCSARSAAANEGRRDQPIKTRCEAERSTISRAVNSGCLLFERDVLRYAVACER